MPSAKWRAHMIPGDEDGRHRDALFELRLVDFHAGGMRHHHVEHDQLVTVVVRAQVAEGSLPAAQRLHVVTQLPEQLRRRPAIQATRTGRRSLPA
jgi:hypothetical protein